MRLFAYGSEDDSSILSITEQRSGQPSILRYVTGLNREGGTDRIGYSPSTEKSPLPVCRVLAHSFSLPHTRPPSALFSWRMMYTRAILTRRNHDPFHRNQHSAKRLKSHRCRLRPSFRPHPYRSRVGKDCEIRRQDGRGGFEGGGKPFRGDYGYSAESGWNVLHYEFKGQVGKGELIFHSSTLFVRFPREGMTARRHD